MMRIAWPHLMRLGLVQLRLTPDVFWSLTPAELTLMAGLDQGQAKMTRAGFAALSEQFPDQPMPDKADLE